MDPDLDLLALATHVGHALSARGEMVATAESCTGGWAAQVLTAAPGSSAWFERGFVTYTNDAKREMLGVPAETLRRFGAVSEETAREMAAGALHHSRATRSLSITGIAGPGGGSPQKPVGLVCFGWAEKRGEPRSATCRFDGDRQEIRRQSVIFALQGLLGGLTPPGPRG